MCYTSARCSAAQSCLTICNFMNGSPPGSSVHGITQQEHCSGLPFPSPEDLPDPGIEPASSMAPALTGGFLPTHSIILAWRSLWAEKPGSTGTTELKRLSMHVYIYFGEGNGNPLQCSCLENPRDGGAWWAAVFGVAQSWTRLKRYSSGSSIHIFIFYFLS